MKKITFSAPGKIIICGEHAVVYGYPALAAAVDRRIYLQLVQKGESYSFRLKSAIPSRSGMGSSAALAAVEQAALLYLAGNHKLDRERIDALTFEMEKAAHGNPSGVDNTIAVYGGILLYQKDKGFKRLEFKKLPQFLLVNTGRPVETTDEMVVGIVGRGVKNKNPRIINSLKRIGKLPKEFVKALKKGDLSYLIHLIKENERLLEELGVVGEKAKAIIRQIENLGGAAKISGGGGAKFGSGIALVYHQNLEVIIKFCRKNKLSFFKVKLGEEGLKKE